MEELLVSEIEIIPIKAKGGLVAFSSFVLNNQIFIGNVALYSSPSSEHSFRLVYPSKTLHNGRELPIVHPINRETGFAIEQRIVEQYLKIMHDLTEKVEKKHESSTGDGCTKKTF